MMRNVISIFAMLAEMALVGNFHGAGIIGLDWEGLPVLSV